MKPALLIIDMLNDFISGPLRTQEAASTVMPTSVVLNLCRSRGVPVFFLNDSHLASDYEIKLWGAHAMKGSEGGMIIAELKAIDGENVIEKHTYSGFFDTALDYLLRSIGVDTVILAGLDADICVRHTAADAYFRGFGIVVVRDAVAARLDKNWESYFKRVYDAMVIESSELNSLLSTG
ncbi:MAG: cysteine hydrolase [Nitrososphaerota archaeon]|nr:cysteine hydrolase [Nitrososphaerota archaeon]MDG7049095.1 cysteine hydrolase [Nitrososphaerota archaeon]MDG7051843.1 cysteine hydrolase [Nitrososphaerota archaeon]